MRILIVNKFDRVTGGADTYTLQLLDLLGRRGHTVRLLAGSDGTVSHKGPADYLLPIKFTRAWRGRTIGVNTKAVFDLGLQKHNIRRLVSEIASFSPDVIHMQNLYYQFSPHLITELRRLGAPMLQTLHDYSYVCNNNYFYHHGKVCEDCRISRMEATHSWAARGARCTVISEPILDRQVLEFWLSQETLRVCPAVRSDLANRLAISRLAWLRSTVRRAS